MPKATKEEIATDLQTVPGKTLKDRLLTPVMIQRIEDVLPKHMDAKRMVLLACSIVADNPTLMQCSEKSVMMSLIEASQIGLEINGLLGHAYLVPFNNSKTGGKDAQLILGYRGLLELARRSGQIQSVQVELVRKGDKFTDKRGIDPVFEHVPKPGNDKDVTHGYAIAMFKDGGHQLAVMSLAQIEDIKKKSPGAKQSSSPWKTYWDEMAKKTLLRRLCKLLPMSTELQSATNVDEYRSAGVMQGDDIIDIDSSEVPPANSMDDLKKSLTDKEPEDDTGDDTKCGGCGTDKNVGPAGLCGVCEDAADAS